jgi:hypothetical protein
VLHLHASCGEQGRGGLGGSGEELSHRLFLHVPGRSCGVAGERPGDRDQGHPRHAIRRLRSQPLPLVQGPSSPRASAQLRPCPPSHQHHRCRCSRAQLLGHRRPRVLPTEGDFGSSTPRSSISSLYTSLPCLPQCGAVYVHAPILTSEDCEGAGEQFRVSTLTHPLPLKDGQVLSPAHHTACALCV